MFSKKKNKDVDATSTAAVETPAAPKAECSVSSKNL